MKTLTQQYFSRLRGKIPEGISMAPNKPAQTRSAKLIGIIFLVVPLFACTTYGRVELQEIRFTRTEIQQDYDALLSFIRETHPDLAYSADMSLLESVAEEVRQSFYDGMTVREAWTAMAVLNPLFGDAHTGLRRPVSELASYEDNGGKLFPVSVVFDGFGILRVASTVPPGYGMSPGDEVLSINGIETSDIVEHLMPRMRGESTVLRRLIMGLYFSEYYWIAYGGFEHYVVQVRNDEGRHTVELTAENGPSTTDGDRPFRYQRLSDSVGYMNVTTFDIEQKDQFETFLASTFARIKASNVRSLIIDLRENGGGARDVSDLLMAYLTDKPYTAISRVTARITDENIERIPGAQLGSVVTVPFQQLVEPPFDYPLRFNGKVYALIGGLTYSQAIVFAATLQDHDIATVIGEETEGPANQSGQVQMLVLPNTGIQVLAPIYIFTRASGDTSRRGVIPDIDIENDPLDPMASVSRLLEMLSE